MQYPLKASSIIWCLSLCIVNKLSRTANKKAQAEKAVNSKQTTLIDISKSSDEEVKLCTETKPSASPIQSRTKKDGDVIGEFLICNDILLISHNAP